MLRRIQVQANDVRRLPLKVGIVAGHVTFESVWLQLGLRQYPLYRRMTHLQVCRKLPARPVSAAVWRLLLDPADYPRLHGRRCRPWATPLVPRFQTGDARLLETGFPPRDRRLGCAERAHDLFVSHTVRKRKDQLCAKHIPRWQGARVSPSGQLFALALVQMQQLIAWHNIQAPTPAARLHND